MWIRQGYHHIPTDHVGMLPSFLGSIEAEVAQPPDKLSPSHRRELRQPTSPAAE
jgi:hypothetical protein